MLPDDVPGAEREDSDLALRALARQSLPAVDGHLVQLAPERGGHDLRHAERGAARRILLEAVVGLGDLDVVLVAERLRHGGEELERDIRRDRHVGREEDRRPAGELGDLGAVGRREAGRADHRPGARLRDEPEVLERGLGDGELDEHPVACDHSLGVPADRDADLPDAGELAGVASQRGVAGRLERGHEAQVGRVGEAGNDAIPHAPGRAGNDDIGRRGASAPDVRGCLPVGGTHDATT